MTTAEISPINPEQQARRAWHNTLGDEPDFDMLIDLTKEAYQAEPSEVHYAIAGKIVADTYFPTSLHSDILPSQEIALEAAKDFTYLWDLCKRERNRHTGRVYRGSHPVRERCGTSCTHGQERLDLLGAESELFFISLFAISRLQGDGLIATPNVDAQDYFGRKSASDITLYMDTPAPGEPNLQAFKLQVTSSLTLEKLEQYDLDSVVVITPELFFRNPEAPDLEQSGKVTTVQGILHRMVEAQRMFADGRADENQVFAWTVEAAEELEQSVGNIEELVINYLTARPDKRQLELLRKAGEEAELPKSA